MKDPLPSALRSPLLPYRGVGVLAAVSGGADSVALLRALHAAGADVTAAHFDHGLRPESRQDAEFVAGLAASLGVPFRSERADVDRVAAARGWNVEDAARRLRYSFLTRAAKAAGLSRILTAHTRRDVAETVMWQLLRGEATLNGIPARRGHVERPWLAVSRADIESYLLALGQPWREDASNADTRYTRNWIRAEVLPLLGRRVENPDALETALARMARFQAQDDEALTAAAQTISAHAPLRGLPRAVLRRYVRLHLKNQSLHAGQIDAAANALHSGQTLHLTLPGNRPLTVSGGRLALTSLPTPRPDFELPGGWELRHRQPGDRMQLSGGTRKLSDVLTDLHVPRDDRERVWLLARGAAVQWVGLTPAVWAVGAQALAGQERQPGDPETDESAMKAALLLARQAAERGEVPVGAVVVCGGHIIAGAANASRAAHDMTRHAELDALRAAAAALAGQGGYLSACTLVVTLEPCPMCLGAALEARIGRIVYGAPNPRAGALGGVSDLLSHHWGHVPQVTGGVLASASARLLRQSFQQFRRSTDAKEP